MAHPPAAVPVKGPSAKVIQLPDIKLSKNTGGKFTPLLSIPKNSQVTKRFLKFFLDLSWFLLFGIGRHGNYFAPSPNNGQIFRESQPPSPKKFKKKKETGQWAKACVLPSSISPVWNGVRTITPSHFTTDNRNARVNPSLKKIFEKEGYGCSSSLKRMGAWRTRR